MAGQINSKSYEMFTRILRQGVALGLCTTMLPFAQLSLQAEDAPQQQPSQYPYQDPGDPSAQQPPPPQYGQQADPQGNGPAGPPPGYGQGGYGQGAQGGYGQSAQGGYDPNNQGAPGGYMPQGPQQLEQLVAPIALYPDSLVAQCLAASTYPQQIAEADRWMQQYGNQPPEQLAQSANAMPWDPSVKALTQFPSVLQQLARSNQWTIALGNAYYNQPADVMAAVQSMRYRAREAGQLRDTPQQVVVDQGPEIIIQPANPEVVYVPYYNPWSVYGEPVPVYEGFYRPGPPIGLVLGVGLAIGFGIGIGIGAFSHFGWGYHAWAPNWRSNTIIVNNNTYISRSTTVYNRGNFGGYNQGFGRSGPQGFSHAAFNRNAPLYNGHPINAANRPVGAGFNRPAPGAAYNRPGGQVGGTQPGAYNRPAGPTGGNQPGAFNRPAGQVGANQPGAYNRPQVGGTQPGAYNRPAGQVGGTQPGAYNRPAQQGGNYNRPPSSPSNQPAYGGAYNRPAQPANRPAPQAAPARPPNGGSARPEVQHSQSGGNHPQPHPEEHGGGDHHH